MIGLKLVISDKTEARIPRSDSAVAGNSMVTV